MPAWLIGGPRQRRRRFCASGWEETKEGAAVGWRAPNEGNWLGFRDRSHLIAALGTRHRTEAPPFKRSCSREPDREINGLIDVLATRTPSAALQTIESAAGSEIGTNLERVWLWVSAKLLINGVRSMVHQGLAT